MGIFSSQRGVGWGSNGMLFLGEKFTVLRAFVADGWSFYPYFRFAFALHLFYYYYLKKMYRDQEF